MICGNCGAEIPDGAGTCPQCGEEVLAGGLQETGDISGEDRAVSEPEDGLKAPPSPENEALPQEQAADSPAETDETLASEAEPESESTESEEVQTARKGGRTPLIAAFAILILVLAAASIFFITKSGKEAGPELTVATVNDYALTNDQFNYYYWGEYYHTLSNYGEYISFLFDPSLPLSEQMTDEGISWEEAFINSAQEAFEQTTILSSEAEKAGFVLPEESAPDSEFSLESMKTYAEALGFESTDEYLVNTYGAEANLENFIKYLNRTYLAAFYSQSVYNEFSFSPEELSDYYDLHSDEYQAGGIEKSELPTANVRHILIIPDSDANGLIAEEDWAQAEEQARQIYEQWQQGEQSEDSFAALAVLNSADGGSQSNGGLYTGVYEGQMVTEFNDWVFDASRVSGDSGIVRTVYGYHIMYFSDFTGEYYWQMAVDSDLRYESYVNWFETAREGYDFEYFPQNISIWEREEGSGETPAA